VNITYRDTTNTTDLDAELRGISPDWRDAGEGVTLLGFSITSTPDPNAYPESYREPAFHHARNLDPANLPDLTGYYAQFVSDGGGMFGWAEPVAEVTA